MKRVSKLERFCFEVHLIFDFLIFFQDGFPLLLRILQFWIESRVVFDQSGSYSPIVYAIFKINVILVRKLLYVFKKALIVWFVLELQSLNELEHFQKLKWTVLAYLFGGDPLFDFVYLNLDILLGWILNKMATVPR